MENINYYLIISIICLFFSILSTIIGLVAIIKVLAMEKSTHTMVQQMVPIDDEIEKANTKTMENWSRQSQREIASDQEKFKEDLEAEFPDFLDDIEDNDDAISF